MKKERLAELHFLIPVIDQKRWLDREAEDFAVQKSEIDYVKWFDLDEAVAAVEQGTIPNCIFPEELGMVKKFVGQTGGGC